MPTLPGLAPESSSLLGDGGQTMISEHEILSRFNKVRKLGSKSAWTALCPGHDDKNPTLSIKLGDKGGLLFKCWAGCTLSEILAGAGLSINDIMPDNPEFKKGQLKQTFPRLSPYEVFQPACYECFVIHTFGMMLRAGKTLSDAQWRRFDQAMEVIGGLSNEVCYGR
jgi:hypothetical protein